MLSEILPDNRELERRVRIVHTLRKFGKSDEAIAQSLCVSVEWVRSILSEDDWQHAHSS